MNNSKQLSLYIPDLTETETPTKKIFSKRKREKTESNAEPIKSSWKEELKKNTKEVLWNAFKKFLEIIIYGSISIMVISAILFFVGLVFKLDMKLIVRLLLTKYIQENFKVNIGDIILR